MNLMRGNVFLTILFVCIRKLPAQHNVRHGRDSRMENLQKSYWYELSGPTGSTRDPGHEYVDYHLAPDPAPAPQTGSNSRPEIPRTNGITNVTVQLGETAHLRCEVKRLGTHTVSWTKRPNLPNANPIALTFNDKVFVADSRIGVAIEVDTWVLLIHEVAGRDEAIYECHVNTDPPLKKTIRLTVEVPRLTVMNGFGQPQTEQFYDRGSSLEFSCEVDKIPNFWPHTENLTGLIIWHHEGKRIYAKPMEGLSIRTEAEGQEGAVSRLAITQATDSDSGNYSCSIERYVTANLRLHILDDEKPQPIATSGIQYGASLARKHIQVAIFIILFLNIY